MGPIGGPRAATSDARDSAAATAFRAGDRVAGDELPSSHAHVEVSSRAVASSQAGERKKRPRSPPETDPPEEAPSPKTKPKPNQRHQTLRELEARAAQSQPLEPSDPQRDAVLGALRELRALHTRVYTPMPGVDTLVPKKDRHEFMEREVVAAALRGLRLARGDKSDDPATPEDFHVVVRTLGIDYRHAKTLYDNRCTPRRRRVSDDIGAMAFEFIAWSRGPGGKPFEACTKTEIADVVMFGQYDSYRQRYHEPLQEEVARQLEPPVSWGGRGDPAGLRAFISYIDRSDRTLYITIFALTLNVVAWAVIRAILRGVDVIALVDVDAAWKRTPAPVVNMLIRAGVPVYEPKDGDMVHMKEWLCDTTIVNISHNANGNPETGTRHRNRESSDALTNWELWKQKDLLKVEQFKTELANSNLHQDEKSVQSGFVTSERQEQVAAEEAEEKEQVSEQHVLAEQVGAEKEPEQARRPRPDRL